MRLELRTIRDVCTPDANRLVAYSDKKMASNLSCSWIVDPMFVRKNVCAKIQYFVWLENPIFRVWIFCIFVA